MYIYKSSLFTNIIVYYRLVDIMLCIILALEFEVIHIHI
jgi:hypothetical protein